MRNLPLLLLLLGAMTILSCAPSATPTTLPHVVIESSLGDIVVEIDTLSAPLTAGNFLALVEAGAYDSSSFYRVVRPDNQPHSPVKIEVIQGGLRSGADARPCVAHETTLQSGLTHCDGAISMARLEPGSASSEFFICLGDQPQLDYGGDRNPDGEGFAVFGCVVEGMEVVRAIQQLQDEGQYLVEPLWIEAITLLHTEE